MIIQLFVFLLSYILTVSAVASPLSVRLSNYVACDYTNMQSSFNATGQNGLLDGTKGPYMLCAVCDPLNNPIVPLTATQIKYHLALGDLAYDQLPADALLKTLSTDNIRCTRYAGIPFLNGAFRLSNTPIEDYYGPTDVTNGVFYRLGFNIVTGDYAPLQPPSTMTILEYIQSANPFPGSPCSKTAIMLTALNSPYVPPSTTSWTFLVPTDKVWATIPQYQQDLLINGGTGPSVDLINNHAINGSHFAAPLSKISTENQLNGTLSPTTYDYYLSVAGKNLTLQYYYQTGWYYLQSNNLTTVDVHCSDGVIHLISNFLFFNEISPLLAPPTPAQFFSQYTTFSEALRLSLGFDDSNPQSKTSCTTWIGLIAASGVILPDVEMTIIMVTDKDKIATSLDQALIFYHIIPSQYTLATLPRDSLIPTLDSPASLRVVSYDNGTSTYVNGFGSIIVSDIKLNKAIVHIIDCPFLLAPPCQPSDLTCTTGDGWINTTIAEDLTTLSDYSIFAGFIQKAGITFPNPYTLFIISDDVFNYGANGAAYQNYFNSNLTAVQEYVQKFYFAGTIYPNIAKSGDANVQSADGTVYTFSILAGAKSVLINQEFQGDANVRNDGVYYEVTIQNPADLFPFDIPAPPVAPVSGPTKPVGPIPPATKQASALRLNGIQIWFYLFFVLAILFLM